jgi:hypothetical protein
MSRTGPSLSIHETVSRQLNELSLYQQQNRPTARQVTQHNPPRHTTCENRVLPLDIDDSPSIHRLRKTITRKIGLLIPDELKGCDTEIDQNDDTSNDTLWQEDRQLN